MKTIKVTTRQMFDLYIDVTKEMIWNDKFITESFDEALKTFITEDMNGIRELFKQGYTCMLVNMDLIDDGTNEEKEIRVYNINGKLIGVVIDSEINY